MNANSIEQACKNLTKSRRGQIAMRELLEHFKDGVWLSLDASNQASLITLLQSAWGPLPGTTMEIMSEYYNEEGGAA